MRHRRALARGGVRRSTRARTGTVAARVRRVRGRAARDDGGDAAARVRITRRSSWWRRDGEPGRTERRKPRARFGPSQQTLLADVAREERARAAEETRTRRLSRFVAMHGTGTGATPSRRRRCRDARRRTSLFRAFETRRRNASTRVRRDASTRAQRSQGALRPHGGRRGRRGSSRGGGTSRARRVRAAVTSAREPVRRVRVGRRQQSRPAREDAVESPRPRATRRTPPSRGRPVSRMSGVNAHAVAIRRGRSGSRRTFRFDIGGRRDEIRDDAIRRARRFAYFVQTAPDWARGERRRRRRRGRVRRTFGRRASFVRERSHRDGNGVVPRGGGRFGVRGDVADAETGDHRSLSPGTTFAAPFALTGYSRAEARTRIRFARRDEVRLVNAATGTAHAAGRLTRATSPDVVRDVTDRIPREGWKCLRKSASIVASKIASNIASKIASLARVFTPPRRAARMGGRRDRRRVALTSSPRSRRTRRRNVAREGSTPSVRVPASMDACGFETADADAFSARRRDAAAGFSPRARSHDGRSETSDHALLASARSRASVRDSW